MRKSSVRHRERGQVLPLIAIALVPLIALMSIAIDVSIWRYQQQVAQTAADSGALAAALELPYSGTPAQLYAAANVDTGANGFAGGATNGTLNSANKVTVAVNNPPSSGSATTNASAVEIIVTKTLPGYFGWPAETISARAVATNPSSDCLVALDPSSSNQGTITLDGGIISMPKCGMDSNGQLLLNGGGTIDAQFVDYRFSYTGSATFPNAMPTLVTAAKADPCSTFAGCSSVTANLPAVGCASNTTFNAPVTIAPGKYCSQVLFNGSGTATLAAGTYEFQQGLNVNGSVSLAGSGVTLYNEGTINFGQGTENLVAPTTGTFANILIYQPSGDTNSMTFNGSAAAVLTGLVYTPGATIILDGTSTTLTEVVAKDVLINAKGTLTFNGSSSSSGGGLTE